MQTEIQRQRFPLESGGTVVLRLTNGEIDARTWNGSEVVVDWEKYTDAPKGRAARRLLESLRFDGARGDGTVELLGRVVSTAWTRLLGPFVDFGIALRLALPRGVRLDAATTNGDIRTRLAKLGADQRIDLRSVNGRVRLHLGPEACPELSTRSKNGTVHVDPAVSERRGTRRGVVRLSSVNGSVEVTSC